MVVLLISSARSRAFAHGPSLRCKLSGLNHIEHGGYQKRASSHAYENCLNADYQERFIPDKLLKIIVIWTFEASLGNPEESL
jgi:hypothetical protein